MIGLNNSSLKSTNSALLVKLLLTGVATNRLQLAEKSGLTKMTISNIVGGLIENEIFAERKTESGTKRGRPGVDLVLSPKAPKVIGVIVDELSVSVYLLSLQGETIQETGKISFAPDATDVWDKVRQGMDLILRRSINERILCVSLVSLNKAVDTNDKIISELSHQYGLPIYFGEYLNAVILSEEFFGEQRGISNFIYVRLDKEIESAVMLNGAPLKTSNGGGINLAHVSIDYNGLSCSCGARGCLQSYISTETMEKKLRDITKLKVDFRGFCEMQTKKNDSRVDWAFKDMMDKLGFALKSVSNILGPMNIVIGGLGTLIPDRYLTKLSKSLSSETGQIEVTKSTVQDKRSELLCASEILYRIANGNIVL